MTVKQGLRAEVSLEVGPDDTALAMGSGSVAVLATPRLMALCEEATMRVLDDLLGADETSVGMQVQLDHLAPTDVGHVVSAEATVERISGRRITFTLSVNDERGLVAVGRVTRVVVDTERFMEKAQG